MKCRPVVLQDLLHLRLSARPEAVPHAEGLVHVYVHERWPALDLCQLPHQPLKAPPATCPPNPPCAILKKVEHDKLDALACVHQWVPGSTSTRSP